MTKAIVLALMVLLVPPSHQKHNNETELDARTRYNVIAEAIASVAGDDDVLASFLLAVGRHESTFKKRIHQGVERGDASQSWGLFQVKCGRSHDARVPGTKFRAHEIVGVDLASTKRAAEATASWLRRHIKGCRGNALCVFKAYGGVGRKTDKKTQKRLNARVFTYQQIRARRKGK